MEPISIILAVAALAVGGFGGYAYRKQATAKNVKDAEDKATKLVTDAETKAKEVVLSAKEEAVKIAETSKKEEKERRDQLVELEKRLAGREEALDKKADDLDKKRDDIDKAKSEIEAVKNGLRELRTKQEEALVKIAKLTKEEAVARLTGKWEEDIQKFDEIHTEIMVLADALTDGIVKQFPDKFK
jgi:ribonuclease Y